MTSMDPAHRASPDWLDLRAGADARARDAGAAGLLEALVAALPGGGAVGPGAGPGAAFPTGGRAAPVRILDVGAGTGANHRYLAPRLPVQQEWVALDHDHELLDHPGHGSARRVRGSVQDLPRLLSGGRGRPDAGTGRAGSAGARGVPTVLVGNAVLDVLTTDDLTVLADAVAATGGPALFSLSVTGRVRWVPADPADHLLSAAFDDHQRRDGRPGPDAPQVLSRLLRERGLQVRTARTPWDLPGPEDGHRELLDRWLSERVDDAVAHDPSGAPALRAWHGRRRDQLASGALRVLVDHVDLLAVGSAAVVGGPDGAPPGE